jgi:L-alanine-DL-glutamate epimerase-like enolase superfamily enzyme
MNRRQFLISSGVAGISASRLFANQQPRTKNYQPKTTNQKSPTNNQKLTTTFKEPIIIEKIELLRAESWKPERAYFVRVSAKGYAPYTMPANNRMFLMRDLMLGLVVPFFIGKDARDVEALVEGVYRAGSNYKFCGMPFWNSVGHVENAILGLLGTIAQKPVAALFGEILRRETPVYVTTFDRESAPEQYIENVKKKLAEYGANAVKIKVGGRMKAGNSGRDEAMIPAFRKALGDSATLYADANGSFNDFSEAMNICKRLHDAGFAHLEEPCEFREFELTKRITSASKLPIAGGEQDTNMPQFRRMIQERMVDIIQPDVMYAGGFLRVLKIAQMAAKAGMKISPHSPRVAHNHAVMLHVIAITPNVSKHQEFQTDNYMKDVVSPVLQVKNGIMPIPLGAGWGVELDNDFIKTLKNVEM